MGALVGDRTSYNLARGLIWQSVILFSAFCFNLFGYFRESDQSAASIFRILVLIAKLCALAYQLVWLFSVPKSMRGRDDTTVAVLAILVILLFSITDVLDMSIVDMSQISVVFVACAAAFLHLLLTAIDRRARQRELEALNINLFLLRVSTALGTLAVLGAFLWAAAAVLSRTGNRDLELVALVLLGFVAFGIVLGAIYVSLYLNRMLSRGMSVTRAEEEFARSPWPPALPTMLPELSMLTVTSVGVALRTRNPL